MPIIDDNGHQTCVQFKPTTSFLVGRCGNDGPAYTPFTIGGTLSSMQYNSFSVSAPFLQLVYQPSDSKTTTSSTRRTTTRSTSSSSKGNASPTGHPNNTKPGSHAKTSKLSAGATAGIAIGAILGAILVATIAFCVRRARRRRQEDVSNLDSQPPESKPYTEVDGDQTPQWRANDVPPPGVVEVNPNHPAELPIPPPSTELGSPHAVR